MLALTIDSNLKFDGDISNKESTVTVICFFHELLEKDRSFTVHPYNIQALAIKSQAHNNLSKTIVFIRQENTLNCHRNREFQILRVNTVWNGTNLEFNQNFWTNHLGSGSLRT